MDSLSQVSPSIVLPPSHTLYHHRHRGGVTVSLHTPNRIPPPLVGVPCSPIHTRRRFMEVSCRSRDGDSKEGEERGSYDSDVERALNLDGTIPGTSDEFVKRVSSRAYGMRRNLQQTFESSSYDVLDANPWRDASKPVYVLTQRENQLCTMRTRRNRSEVEKELGQLFSKVGKWGTKIGNQPKQSSAGTKFQMLVEDITEGVLVFEDENEAAKYCDLLQGKGKGCEGVAEIEASSVFDLCQKMRALAVLFRRGTTPPLPESLELNLRARKRSLEDEQDLTGLS